MDKQFNEAQSNEITDLLNDIGGDEFAALSSAIDDVMFASTDESRAAAFVRAREQFHALRESIARLDVKFCDPEGQWNDEAVQQ